MAKPQPYDLTVYGGKKVDWLTRAALEAVDRRIKQYNLTLSQGSYNGGENEVAASGNTHDGGGVVDLPEYEAYRKMRLLRRFGFWAWVREELWRDGKKVWSKHVHAVQEGNKKLSQSAKDQVEEGHAGGDGLVGNSPDPHSDIPVIPFQWPYYGIVGTLRWKMRSMTPARRKRVRAELATLIERH